MKLTTWLRRTAIVLSSSGAMAMSAQADDTNLQSYELDIDALPLTTAVKTLSDETGIEVLYFSEIAEGVTSSPVQGEYTPTEALETMLTSTDLEVVDLDKEGAVAIAFTSFNQGGDSEQKNLSPAPVLMAQNTSQTTASTETTSRSSEGGTSVVTGKVTDARTGANLKGAKVTIEETGQWTATNDLGEFRFANVPTGSATLTVSYLGYAGQSAGIAIYGDGVSQNFALRGGGEIEEIVVFGQRSGRAQALNQERTSNNFTTVLSSDLLGQFNGTTISEALRRAPGVAFEQNSRTGDGSNVIIRGLEPDLNQIQLNGLRLAESSGTGRSPDLSSLLTESIEKVTIHKTLLPNQDSNGAGGLIEIETKSPFDRQSRFASFGVERGERDSDFGEDILFSGTLSGIFGTNDDFGVSVSVQYRDRSQDSAAYGINVQTPQYLPPGITSVSDIDPATRFPFEPGVNDIYPSSSTISSVFFEDQSLTVNSTLATTVGSHTRLRLDFSHIDVESSRYGSRILANPLQGYLPAPIDELNGEERYALTSEDLFTFFGVFGVIGDVSRSASFSLGEVNETNQMSLRGETVLEAWEYSYGAGFSKGESLQPMSGSIAVGNSFGFTIDQAFLNSDILNNTNNGSIVSIYAPLTPGNNIFALPSFNQAGVDFYNTINNAPLDQASIRSGESGENERITARVSAKRSFDVNWLDHIDVGLQFEEATFDNYRAAETSNYSALVSDVTLLGLEFAPGLVRASGAPYEFLELSRASVLEWVNNTDQLVSDNLLSETVTQTDPIVRRVLTEERDWSVYAQGNLVFGNFEIVGGLRVSRIDVSSEYFIGPEYTDEFGVIDFDYPNRYAQRASGDAQQTNILPRILISYRHSDKDVIRAGYFTTVSRPQVQNLARNSVSSLDARPVSGPSGNQARLAVFQGNPDLEPALTHSFDVSYERYFGSIGAIKLSLFYKQIENSLQTSSIEGSLNILPQDVVLPDTPEYNNLPTNLLVEVTQPVNGDDDARIWGSELSIEQQFSSLPGLWGGLGTFINYTYTDSARDWTFSSGLTAGETFVLEDEPFEGSPKHSGSAAITYSQGRFDGSLIYSWQDRRLQGVDAFSLSPYDEEVETLDLRLEYMFPILNSAARIFFEGHDLLRNGSEPYIETSIGGENGVAKYFTGGRYFGGRMLTIGASWTF